MSLRRRKKSNAIIDKPNDDLFFSSMLQHRFPNNSSAGRKQQTALKQTVDRPKPNTWYKETINHRTHPYLPSSINEDTNNWSKSSNTRIFDDIPELELICQEESLTDAQLQNYPTQVILPRFW